MHKLLSRTCLVGALGAALLTSACATTEDLMRVEATANQALATANSAQSSANAAGQRADQAMSAAQSAMSAAQQAQATASAAQAQAQANQTELSARAAAFANGRLRGGRLARGERG